MIEKIGELVDRVKTSVKEYNILEHSSISVRIGDFGEEMLIEHVKVTGGVNGHRLILQLAHRQ